MNVAEQKLELLQIEHEYREFLQLIELKSFNPSKLAVVDYSNPTIDVPPSQISFFLYCVTLEGFHTEVSVSEKGWRAKFLSYDSSSTRNPTDIRDFFETFEALMLRISPEFNRVFNTKLTEKLELLIAR